MNHITLRGMLAVKVFERLSELAELRGRTRENGQWVGRFVYTLSDAKVAYTPDKELTSAEIDGDGSAFLTILTIIGQVAGELNDR